MAHDMMCKLCEGTSDPEVAVLLVSDLTGSGQLPLPVGPRCLPVWLNQMRQIFGIWNPAAQAVDYLPGTVGWQTASDASLARQELTGEMEPVEVPEGALLVPTETPKQSGRSRRGTSAPAAGNGTRRARKKDETPEPASP
jgi:hypothetical protein